MKILYTAVATAKGGRNGHAETSDGTVKLELAVPKEMGGTGKKGTNPEQLFAIGYSACFGGSLDFVAKQKKKNLKDIEVTGHVSFGQRDEGGFGLAIQLDVHIPDVSREEAEALVAEAHKVCPYSNSIRGNVDVVTKII
jgi:lipoyl-dependent peroxiredoxin